MHLQTKYSQLFFKLLEEDITSMALGGSTGGFNPDASISSSDFYAPGNAIIPKGGPIQRRTKLNHKRRRKLKRKKKISVN